MLLTAANAVLLLVDFQERLVPVIHDGETVVTRAVRLAEAARALMAWLAPVRSPELLAVGLS